MKSVKTLVNFFTVLSFISLLYPLNAQHYCDVSTRDTYMEIVENIQYCYGPGISIDNAVLIDFLSWKKGEWYDASLDFPLADVSEGSEVNFFEVSWQSVEEALGYEVKSLNLRTGAVETYSFENEIFSNEEIDPMAYYLYVFSSKGEIGIQTPKSADFIIIDEKPVLHSNLEIDPLCSCFNTQPGTYLGKKKGKPAAPNQAPLRIFPNPSNGESQLEYSLSSNQRVSIWLSDLLGGHQKVVLPQTLQAAGTHHLTLDLGKYSNGWYQVHLQTEKDYRSQRILKLE